MPCRMRGAWDRVARIVAHDVERVLADIDADHGDHGRHGAFLVFGAPCQSLVGGAGAPPNDPISRRCCDSKIAKLRASLTQSLRLDHNKISCRYGYAPFQSVGSKFKSNLRI